MNDKVGDGTTTSENELIGSKFLSVKNVNIHKNVEINRLQLMNIW